MILDFFFLPEDLANNFCVSETEAEVARFLAGNSTPYFGLL
jgi:hypothetical protein